MDTEQRLIELETRLAHFERMVEDLSQVIADQGGTIALLTTQLRFLRDRLGEVEAGHSRSPQDDRPPPHY